MSYSRSQSLDGVLRDAWNNLAIQGANLPPPTPQQIAASGYSIYRADDPSAVVRLASKFLVENVPANADVMTLYILLNTDNIGCGVLVNAIRRLNDVSDSALIESGATMQKEMEKNADSWYEAMASGAAALAWPISEKAGARWATFLAYCYEVAAAGMHLHDPELRAQIIASGQMTEREMQNDYLMRRGVFQAIRKIALQEPFKSVLTLQHATSGLGNPIALPVAAVIAGIVVAVALVAAIAYCVVSIYTLKKDNELKQKIAEGCLKEAAQTGKSSAFCTKFGEGVSKPALPATWQDKAVLYGAIIAAGALAVYALPTIVSKVMEARSRAGAR